MKRFLPASFAIAFFVVPLFPAFITLTAVTIPGVSLVPGWFAIALLAVMAVVAIYATIMLLQPPRERPPTMLPLLAWFAAIVIAGVLGFDPAAGMLFNGIFGLGVIWHLTLMRYYREPGVARAI